MEEWQKAIIQNRVNELIGLKLVRVMRWHFMIGFEFANENNEIIAIELLEDVETTLLEGKLFEWDDENAIFVEFVNPPKQDENSDIILGTQDSSYFLYPYCKLRLVFKKTGTYTLRLRESVKTDPWSNFDGGCYFTKINVVE